MPLIFNVIQNLQCDTLTMRPLESTIHTLLRASASEIPASAIAITSKDAIPMEACKKIKKFPLKINIKSNFAQILIHHKLHMSQSCINLTLLKTINIVSIDREILEMNFINIQSINQI